MGYHSFRDSLFCSLHGMKLGLSGRKFFSRGIDSPVLAELYDSTQADVPQIEGEGIFAVKASIGARSADPALHILRWLGEGFPVIIYHHFSGEMPIDASARKIFFHPKKSLKANIILVQAACHASPSSFSECAQSLHEFASMTAVSVRVIDELVSQLKERKFETIVCGLKLGGWAANLHHALSNTASAYIPLFAGAGFGDIFIDSKFSKCVSSEAKKQQQRVRRVLNFDDLFMARGNHSNVFPLLAAEDQIALFVRQRPAYGDMKFTVLNKGHISGALSHSKIREHILRVMDKKRK